ncbi:hypothetical protein UACE39S_05772 [Ureibacillus acetophenoni]
MGNTIQQTNPIERMEISSVLLNQQTKKEYKYQQTCYIENVTKRMYEENLAQTNIDELIKEMQNKIENAFDEYLASEEGKSSEYAHINDRNKRMIEDEKYSIMANAIEKDYEPKLNKLREQCKVDIKEVFPNLPIEAGDIVFSVSNSAVTEVDVKEMAASLVKEWSEELISTNKIACYEIEMKITLSDGKVIEKSQQGSFITSTFE